MKHLSKHESKSTRTAVDARQQHALYMDIYGTTKLLEGIAVVRDKPLGGSVGEMFLLTSRMCPYVQQVDSISTDDIRPGNPTSSHLEVRRELEAVFLATMESRRVQRQTTGTGTQCIRRRHVCE